MEPKIVKQRLTSQQKESIIRLYVNGTPISHLSQQFRVSRPTIYSIVEKMDEDEQNKIDFYFENQNVNKEMSDLVKTNLLGVTIDTENGTNNPKIRKALDKSFRLLNIMEFIKITDFELNMTMFDYFWQVVIGNTRLHLVERIFEWFGYEGEYRKQRENFIRMLKRNNIPFQELTQKDKEIELYPTIKEELSLIPSNVTNSKFLIMEPNDLKMAIMQLKTKNGHIIRQYYIDLEELLKLYVEYTLYFNHREAQRKITDLEELMVDLKLTNKRQEEMMLQQTQYMRSLGISLEEVKDQNEELLGETKNLKEQNKGLKKDVKEVKRKLGIAVEDRAPLPVHEDKQERFVLLKRNDDEHYQYYTIRAQHKYTERRLKIQKTLFPQLQILLDFKANPNSKTLYNRIKDTLKAKNVSFDGNNIDLEDSDVTQQELIEEMKVINDQKYEV